MAPTPPKPSCCAVILSGGRNSRMAGQNKAFLQVDGQPILRRLLDRLQPFFSEILLVTRDPEAYAGFALTVVNDLYDERASLTGIHAGLVQAKAEYAFIIPCDTPFLQPAVIQVLLDSMAPEWDVIVPCLDGYYEPLCAIYSKRCIPAIEAQLDRKDYKIFNFFCRMKMKTLSRDQIKAADPKLRSFFNVNTPRALLACQKMLEKRK